ncbi:uncharacterized protein BT62DRAFT_1078614 [Guyanagaster necrorhizus]|uniref:Uncharacterized protein n=1 Tax=Guyanagaster necrorhizus TaxID=856835 RepID=A0A9P8APD9_9AGAR|nr:uncharacterized protein BT62DRAFT_1078614 [Guyanagaster necrorhizus MCA 3950]KAG7443238.1 hypothetical protein BT62DRAFT_1078614 [Guyanagaster necrorhizus MCA 3950]
MMGIVLAVLCGGDGEVERWEFELKRTIRMTSSEAGCYGPQLTRKEDDDATTNIFEEGDHVRRAIEHYPLSESREQCRSGVISSRQGRGLGWTAKMLPKDDGVQYHEQDETDHEDNAESDQRGYLIPDKDVREAWIRIRGAFSEGEDVADGD